ncbi:MAG TPA: hypothetical protein VN040_04715 [Pseudosphingobacterium sp.]|nr:hypothetical protein [Pseudosphingobacterium sp.]
MNSEKNNMLSSSNPRNNTISLEKAKEETKRWRHFLAKKSKDFNIKTINKGAFISFADIDALKKLHDKDGNIIGVRAYFALEEEKRKDNTPLHHVKLVLVAVEKGGKNGKDILEIPSSSNEAKQSAIYDFTMPCPDCCDETSQLY